MKKTILTMGSLLLAGSLFAQWQKVDDLEALAEGFTFDETNADGTGDWKFYKSDAENYAVLPTFSVVADPFDAGQGNVLSLDPGSPAETGNGNTTLERNLPEGMRILDPLAGGGDSATFYFRYARPIVEGVPGQADTTWGLTSDQARDPVSGTHAYGSYSVLGRTEIDGIIDIRNGGDYTNLVDSALDTNTWYEFWFVIDHGAKLPADEFDETGTLQSFTMYIKGGSDFPEQTQLPVGSPINALYRNATFDALNTILLVTTTGGQASLKGQDPVYFDDFYVDVNATNLTSPGTPPPPVAWQKIEDLEGLAEGYQFDETNSDGTGDWKFYKSDAENYAVLPTFSVVADPFGAGQGNVLSLDPGSPAETGNGNTTLERNLAEGKQIVDPLAGGGDSATFYFRYARPIVEGVPGQADTTWGLTSDQARDPVSGTHAYGSYSVLGRTEIDGIIDIRNGGDYTNLVDSALDTNTWYEFWFVVDHGAKLPADEFDETGTLQSFTMYIKGGTDFPEQTQLPVGSPINALYRNATFDPLNTILLVTTTGGQASLKGQDPVYFDDFYIDVTGTNLSSPGAPVVDTTPRAVGEDAGSTTITLKADAPADAVAGRAVFAGETELGIIASVEGAVITLEDPLAAALAADTGLSFRAVVVDTTPRGEAADAGATMITVANLPAEVVAGMLVFDDGGNELGKIASIAGNVLTLEAALAAALPADTALTFVEDNTGGGFEISIGGKFNNISTRGMVGTGDDVLIGGFVIGDDDQTVLIQATGPELANAGVANVLLDPVLVLNDTSNPANPIEVGSNDNWQDDQGQLITDLWGGAPPLADGSLSAAIVITLPAGSYTGTISGAGGTTGNAVFEVYQIDQ